MVPPLFLACLLPYLLENYSKYFDDFTYWLSVERSVPSVLLDLFAYVSYLVLLLAALAHLLYISLYLLMQFFDCSYL